MLGGAVSSRCSSVRPAPWCRAVLAAKMAAPVMPGAPPITKTSPKLPLWLLCGRCVGVGAAFSHAVAGCSCSALSQSSVSHQISPQASRPSPVKRPGLSVRRLRVWRLLGSQVSGGRQCGVPNAVVRIKACGDVNGQRMRGAAVAAVQQLLHGVGCRCGLRALAKPEEGVNHHIVGAQRGCVVHLQPMQGALARLLPGAQGAGAAVLWRCLTSAPRQSVRACASMGSFQAIATIVAGAAQHPGLACMGERLRRPVAPQHGLRVASSWAAGVWRQAACSISRCFAHSTAVDVKAWWGVNALQHGSS